MRAEVTKEEFNNQRDIFMSVPTASELATCEQRAAAWRSEWAIAPETIYLNHGSFAPTPRCVQESLARWTAELSANPMDFYLRRMEAELDGAARELAAFIGANRECLTFVDNATTGMNVVVSALQLKPDDEVLLNDHEYGAVFRIWRRMAQTTGARVVTADLPDPLTDASAVVDAILARVTARTRLIVVSHVTSATAVILPVDELCRRARERGVAVCIDGPHAVAMVPVQLGKLDCDFCTASCHKWLSGPLGSGFLYVAPRWQKLLQPVVVSWGGSVGGRQPSWKDEFNWIGTRNPAPSLSVPKAIQFLNQPAKFPGENCRSALDEFRQHARSMIRYAAERVSSLTGLPPFIAELDQWCGSMVSIPLPLDGPPPKPGQRDPLQDALWEKHRIEIPIVHWKNRRFVRVSAHLYNAPSDIDRLLEALRVEVTV